MNSVDLFNVAENAIKVMKKVQFPSLNTEEMEELDEENIKEEEAKEPPKNPATKITKKVRDEIIKKLR
jgi:hypothetical protein